MYGNTHTIEGTIFLLSATQAVYFLFGGGGGSLHWLSFGKLIHSMYHDIISLENLLEAWREFLRGKRHKKDVQEFQVRFMDNLLDLHADLQYKRYRHGGYHAFTITDPKSRHIHKASVRDRLLHHAIYRVLYSYFDKKFIYDSYSCRRGKGTHKALNRFRQFSNTLSHNRTKTVWVLKCDIRKFFASIDQDILLKIVRRHISDTDTIWLIERVVRSFESTGKGKGLPLGNLTSQLLVNVYMDVFDQYVKHGLTQKYYIRYADDFVIMHHDRGVLLEVLVKIYEFLDENLKLTLHPDKIFLKTVSSGVDFLGWIHFSDHRVLRAVTKRRMLKNVKRKEGNEATVQSYLGLLGHGNARGLQIKVKNTLNN